MRAMITVQVENNHIGIAGNTSHISIGKSFDEKVINFVEARAWCHNVSNVSNIRFVGRSGNTNRSVILVDVEYNMN